MNIGHAINELIAGKDLTCLQTEKIFRQIILNHESQMDQGAFLAAITAKGPVSEEVAAIWKVIDEIDTNKVEVNTDCPLAENSGTGMDAFKTFNISTVAAVVAASAGVAMARHGSKGITSKCGTVDVAEALGVNAESNVDKIGKSIEKCGIGLFNGMSPSVHPSGLGRILNQIHFGSVLNIAASLANPCSPVYGVRGVNDPSMIASTAEIMKSIGYRRVLVLHGFLGEDCLGIDEASTLGKTVYTEIDAFGKVTKESFYPEDLGLKRGKKEDIAALDHVEREAQRIRGILDGKGSDSARDIVALNAGLILYVTGLAQNIKKGVECALEKIETGKCSVVSTERGTSYPYWGTRTPDTQAATTSKARFRIIRHHAHTIRPHCLYRVAVV